MTYAPPDARRVRFGLFEFDPATGELHREGRRIPLQEQPAQVLATLLEQPGQVRSREELRARLWKTDTFVDFEHGLNTAIKKVRHALGDSADNPRFVETLAKRGYRFIAPVSQAAPAPIQRPAARVEGLPVPAPPDRHRAGLRSVLVFVLGLLSIAGAGVWLGQHRERVSPTRRQAQLAVIPLRVLAAPDGQDSAYLGIGIADAITTRLANVRQIAVRPTSAVLPFSETDSDPARIAAALGVQHLLLGTIQPGETYRLTMQLVKADGVAVWGHTYDVPRRGLLDLQDIVAEQVASALSVELSPGERARLHRRHTQNAAAYDVYLRGRSRLVDYSETNMPGAIADFERALMLDPQFAAARAALAVACAWFSVRYAYESDAASWGKRAEEEARRALQQDPSLGDARLAIASAAGTLYRGFDWKTLLIESATALTLDPSLELAHVARMRAYYHMGLFDEARQEGRRARALNPGANVEAARLEVALELFAGRFDAAAARATSLLTHADVPAVRHYLGLARYYMGDVEGARALLASVKRRERPDVRAQASLASIEAAAGLRREARARATALARGSYMDHHVAYSLGATFAQLGDVATAMAWLERAASTGFACYPWFERDPLLGPLRDDAAFRRLLDRLRSEFEQAGADAR